MSHHTRLPFVLMTALAATLGHSQTAISSTFHLGVYADANQTNGGFHQDFLTLSQNGTLNPYSGSLAVTDEDMVHTGKSLTVRSSASASWTDVAHGSVQWRRMGWDHNTGAQSASKLNGFVVNGPVWSYTFLATSDDTFSLNYDVRGSGMQFGLLGVTIEWSGPGGGLDLANPYTPVAHGLFSRTVTAGETYTVGLFNMGNIFTSLDPRVGSGYMDADFNWNVGPVPEPSSLLALGGLIVVAIRRRKVKQGTENS